MPSKKPPVVPSPAARPSTQPPTRPGTAAPPNPRQQPDNRWHRTKRYGWDSR